MSLMSLFGRKKEEEYQQEEGPEQDGPEFDVVKAISGMTEKQLLRLIFLSRYSSEEETISDEYQELINISKEEA